MGIRDTLLLTPFLLSDGGVSPKGKSGWLIYFRNNDKSLVSIFADVLQRVTKNKIQIQEREDRSYMVRVNDKELGNKLHEFCGSFRTRPCNVYPPCPKKNGRDCGNETGMHRITIPARFFNDPGLRRKFLQIYVSCDGGVSVTSSKGKYPFLVRKVFVNARHDELREQLRKLFAAEGFTPKIYFDQLRLTTKEDIVKFRQKIGFVDGAKVGGDSARFKGWEKNKLLAKVIHSYGNPRELLDIFALLQAQTGLDTPVVPAVNDAR